MARSPEDGAAIVAAKLTGVFTSQLVEDFRTPDRTLNHQSTRISIALKSPTPLKRDNESQDIMN